MENFKGKLSKRILSKKQHLKYPNEFHLKITSTIEDIRANWTTFRNLDEWFTQNKQPPIET